MAIDEKDEIIGSLSDIDWNTAPSWATAAMMEKYQSGKVYIAWLEKYPGHYQISGEWHKVLSGKRCRSQYVYTGEYDGNIIMTLNPRTTEQLYYAGAKVVEDPFNVVQPWNNRAIGTAAPDTPVDVPSPATVAPEQSTTGTAPAAVGEQKEEHRPDLSGDTPQNCRCVVRMLTDATHETVPAMDVRSLIPDVEAIKAKTIGELKSHELRHSYEIWLRENIGWMPEYHATFYKDLLATIDDLREFIKGVK